MALEHTDKGIQLSVKLHSSVWLLKFQLLKAEILLSQNRAEEAKPLVQVRGRSVARGRRQDVGRSAARSASESRS